MHNFRELKVWQKSINLVGDIYEVTLDFPDKEKYGLVTQMQRAAVSIPSNIAEGCGRQTVPAFKQFLSISLGSAYELETQIIISHKLHYLRNETCEYLLDTVQEIQRMTYALMGRS